MRFGPIHYRPRGLNSTPPFSAAPLELLRPWEWGAVTSCQWRTPKPHPAPTSAHPPLLFFSDGPVLGQGVLLAWRWLLWQLCGYVRGRWHSNSRATRKWKHRSRLWFPKIRNSLSTNSPRIQIMDLRSPLSGRSDHSPLFVSSYDLPRIPQTHQVWTHEILPE